MLSMYPIATYVVIKSKKLFPNEIATITTSSLQSMLRITSQQAEEFLIKMNEDGIISCYENQYVITGKKPRKMDYESLEIAKQYVTNYTKTNRNKIRFYRSLQRKISNIIQKEYPFFRYNESMLHFLGYQLEKTRKVNQHHFFSLQKNGEEIVNFSIPEQEYLIS